MENVVNNIPDSRFTAVRNGYDVTLTVTADEGYKFTGEIKAQYTDGYGDYRETPMTLSSDKKTATLTDEMEQSQITLTGVTISEDVPEPTVINNIADTTLTVSFDTVKIDITVQSRRYPRGRFYDTGVQYTNTAGETATAEPAITVNQYDSTATVTITDADRTKPITINGVFGGVHLLEVSLTGCSSVNPLPEFVKPNGALSVQLIANENTEFETAPVLSWQNEYGYYKSKNFDVSSDKTTATAYIDTGDPATEIGDYQSIDISGDTVPVTVIGTNYGSINVYRVTLDNLADFAKKRFFRSETTAGETNYYLIDLGQYVNRIKRIHTEIPTGSTDQIKCGNYETGIECLAPSKDRVTLDFGSVEIPAHNNDNTDYQSEIQLFLPFKGFVSVPVEYVGKSVRLEYVINTVTGEGIARLSYNGIVFLVEDAAPSTDIIYTAPQNDTINLVGADSWNEQLLYGLEPYIKMKWYTSKDKGNRNKDNVTDYIGNFKGFIRAEHVGSIANANILTSEQRAIYEQLEQGVYIE